MIILTVLGSLGGLIAFASAIYVVLRGAFSQAQAIKDNTEAIKGLTDQMGKMWEDQHDIREDVAYLKGRARGEP